MRLPALDASWPESWKTSYHFDVLEIDGARTKAETGYIYAYRNRSGKTIELVKRFVPPASRILDVAAAQGNLSLRMAELGYEVTWNDLRADLADYVRLKYERGTIKFLPGDITQLDPDQMFDAVVATEVIEHTAHPDGFLLHLAGFIRPGGHLIASTPNGAYACNILPKFSSVADPSVFEAIQFQPDADGHIFLLYPEEVPPLGRHAGLDLVHLELSTNALTAGWSGMERVLGRLPETMVQKLEGLSHRLPETLRRKVMTHMAFVLRKPLVHRELHRCE